MKNQVGLVLSGGGVKGLAHAGAIKALEELGLEPACVSGTSVGAIVGALYAAGYPAEEILRFFKETKIFQVSHYSFRKPGLVDTGKLEKFFRAYLEEDSFEVLAKKLYINATDIINVKSVVFESGPLIKALLASSAFPMIFTPVLINGNMYADGGIMNNFPVEPLLETCDKIIGVHVSPIKTIEASELKNPLSILERAYDISVSVPTLQKLKHCHWLIEPPELKGYAVFDMRFIDEIFNIGYEAALKVLEKR